MNITITLRRLYQYAEDEFNYQKSRSPISINEVAYAEGYFQAIKDVLEEVNEE